MKEIKLLENLTAHGDNINIRGFDIYRLKDALIVFEPEFTHQAGVFSIYEADRVIEWIDNCLK